MRGRDLGLKAGRSIKQSGKIGPIAFVVLAEAGQIDDVTATENFDLFLEWAYPVTYAVGQMRRHGCCLFRCIQAHTSQADWTPDATPAMWEKIGDPAEEWPQWKPKLGGHMIGARVSNLGRRWESLIDHNVWEPGTPGTEALWRDMGEVK